MNISHRMFKGLCVWFMGVLIFTIPFFVAQPTCEAYRVLCRKGAWQIIQEMPFDFKDFGLKESSPFVADTGEQFDKYFSYSKEFNAGLEFICSPDGYVFMIRTYVPYNQIAPYNIPFHAFWAALGFASPDLNDAAQQINVAIMSQRTTSVIISELGERFYFYSFVKDNFQITSIYANQVELNQPNSNRPNWIEAY